MFKMQRLNNNKNVEYKEGTNLLDGGSTDSELEQFSLPQNLNLKGAKKKQGKVKKYTPKRCCSLGQSMTVLGLVLLTAVVGVLGAYTYSLKLDVNDLKGTFKQYTDGRQSEEGPKDGSSNSVMEIQTKQENLLKTVADIQDGDKGIEKLYGMIIQMTEKLNKLNETTNNLAKGIAEAPVLMSLPKKVDDLSNNVASMGSDIQNLKGSVGELKIFKTQIMNEVEDLTQKIDGLGPATGDKGADTPGAAKPDEDMPPTASTPSPSSVDNNALEQYVTQQVERFNTGLNAVNASLTQMYVTSLAHKVHFDALENKTSMLDSRLSLLELTPGQSGSIPSPDVNAIVKNVLEQVHNATVDEGSAVDEQKLQSLTNRVLNITSHITQLQSQIEQVNNNMAEKQDMKASFDNYVDKNDQRLADVETRVDQVASRLDTLTSGTGINLNHRTTEGVSKTPAPGGPPSEVPTFSLGPPLPPRDDLDSPGSADNDTPPVPLQHSTSSTPKPIETTPAGFDSYYSGDYDQGTPGDVNDNPKPDYYGSIPSGGSFDEMQPSEGREDDGRNRRLVSDDEVQDLLNSL